MKAFVLILWWIEARHADHITMMARNTDRSGMVPRHNGPNVLPNSPFFGKLLRHARRDRIALRDVGLGVEKTYG